MMTEKELISKLQTLKQIEPREDWVILVKSEIFRERITNTSREIKFIDTTSNWQAWSAWSNVIKTLLFRKRLAYILAMFLFIAVGLFSVMQYGWFNPDNSELKIAEITPAALVAIKNEVEDFKIKSKNLSELAQYKPEAVPLAVREVEKVARELTTAIQKDPQLAKEIALEVNNNKTYLEIPGSDDLKETSEVLYKTIDGLMIKDLENTTLTESQQEALEIIKDLYNQRKYASALESILLLNSAMNQK